jgi:transcriptional regulator with XRE-family HTH domain
MIAGNLKFLRNLNNISQAELAEQLSIPRTTLSAYERGFVEPNIDLMTRMSKYFKVSIDDLIAYNIEHKKEAHPAKEGLRVLAISVDSLNNSNIELVDKKAEAGYLDSMADPQFIKELPKIHFPNIPQGTYRGFEIRGDSMLPVVPGSVVISSYVENIKDIRDGKTYVLISKSEGVVYKRLKKNQDKKELTCISDNTTYAPYQLPYSEVAEVWQYYAHLTFEDPKQTFDALMDDRLTDVHMKVSAIHDKVLNG